MSDVKKIRMQFEDQQCGMSFCRNVIDLYFQTAAPNQLKAVNALFAKVYEVRRGNSGARLLKQAELPGMKSIGGFDFERVVFDRCGKERMLSEWGHRKKPVDLFASSACVSCETPKKKREPKGFLAKAQVYWIIVPV